MRAEADLREIVSVGPTVEAARDEPAAKTWFGPFNLAGDAIEWRRVSGAKAPFAIIQRWTVSDSENPDTDGTPKPFELMIVTRLPPGPVCHVALVDAREKRRTTTRSHAMPRTISPAAFVATPTRSR